MNTIGGRQKNYGEEMILNPLVDTCIALRILPTPTEQYAWEWPPLLTESEQEKAETALGWSRALAAYAGTGGSPQDILPLEIYLQDILGWAPEQVENILDLLGKQEAARPATRPMAPAPAADETDQDPAALAAHTEPAWLTAQARSDEEQMQLWRKITPPPPGWARPPPPDAQNSGCTSCSSVVHSDDG